MVGGEMIAVCGLDCGVCDIRQAAGDPGLARGIVDWFRESRGEEVAIEQIRCAGCRGDRAQHWSADCWILECCVDQKGLAFCCECGDFPCGRLTEWAAGSERYGAALERLRETAEVFETSEVLSEEEQNG